MSKESGSGSGSGGGLLSKMVKFVTSPTTHWSDLDRPEGEGDDGESRLALKEMIERKRRNDFVRNREFDMLRKMRRRGGVPDENAAGAASFYPSSQPANTGERARTLKKIDEIEAQMSTAWFKRRQAEGGDGAQADPGPAPAVSRGASGSSAMPGAYDRTSPAPLTEHAPTGPHDLPAAFSPTVTMDAMRLDEPLLEQPLDTPAAQEAPQPATKPRAAAIGFGAVSDFDVEVVAAQFKQDPEIEETAIRFANGDTEGAEASLLELLAEGQPRRHDVDTWLTLFDLYRASGQHEKFDDAALDFAARFGRSAPQWALVTAPAESSAPAPAEPVAVSGALYHWVCPSVVGTQSVAALNASLTRNAPPWRIDWRNLKTIDPSALAPLYDAFRRWGSAAGRFKFLGTDRLLQVLAEKSPTDDRSVDPMWWQARLALLRVLGEMDEFELVALNYCVTYEVSPPAWEEPVNAYARMAEDGQTIPPSEFGPDVEPSAAPVAPTFAATDIRMGHSVPPFESGAFRSELQGELLGSAEAALRVLQANESAKAFELHCRALLRVDFGAAGDLLNWTLAQKGASRPVTFTDVNRLVAAFFGVIGITEAAQVLLRTD